MIERITNIYTRISQILEIVLMPALVLLMRFWMARIFWYSGLTKISDWQATIYLFKDEYKVPVIPFKLAAYISTSIELIAPILLLFGLATRLIIIPMLAMTFVIQFTYKYSNEHYYWSMLLLSILCYGPGAISLDNFIKKNFYKNTKG